MGQAVQVVALTVLNDNVFATRCFECHYIIVGCVFRGAIERTTIYCNIVAIIVAIAGSSKRTGQGRGLRSGNEGIRARIEVCFVSFKNDVLNGQRFRAVEAAITVNDNLSGDGVFITLDGEVETSFLTYNRVAGNVVYQLYGYVAGGLVC